MCGASPIAVGLLYNPHVPFVLDKAPDAVDYLSIVPDVLQVDLARRGNVGRNRFDSVEVLLDTVGALARHWPMIGHGVGLSIGSPRPLDRGYLNRMRWWVERLQLRWYSEHLSFFRLARGSTAVHEAGLACPLPYDEPVLKAIVRRSRDVAAAIGVPFLLENGVSYVKPVDDDLTEAAFLNALCTSEPVSLLLDLHNCHVNARNQIIDAGAFLDEIDPAHITELHVAGGDSLLNYYTDAHSGAVPEAVWESLRVVLPRAVRLRAITFEYHESAGSRLGVDGVLAQLNRAREEVARAGRESGWLKQAVV